MKNKEQTAYGDWQTNYPLALSICKMLKAQGINPNIILEPTCGKGHFILAALEVFDNLEEIYGIEIQAHYLKHLKTELEQKKNSSVSVHLTCGNIFSFSFSALKKNLSNKKILILGNPPWVTNSKLTSIGSQNTPDKANFLNNKGIDALTGKGTFDIGEAVLRQMLDLLCHGEGHLALLLKNSVIRNIVQTQRNIPYRISHINQYQIDADKEFGAAVAASLLVTTTGNPAATQCSVYDFYSGKRIKSYGWIQEHFVADTITYSKFREIDGKSPLIWRSGVKHDCAKIMELTYDGDLFYNGLGEKVDIESECIYPLLKSSDISARQVTKLRRYLILTQKHTTDDTHSLRITHPKMYSYLIRHSDFLDKRSSRIYRSRPRFCLFGIGDYSFAPYKVVVSGLYKHMQFALSLSTDKPVMADDTCYILGFENKKDAEITHKILNHPYTQTFIRSILFDDAKRIISKELLSRIDLIKAAEIIGANELNIPTSELNRYINMLRSCSAGDTKQLHLNLSA